MIPVGIYLLTHLIPNGIIHSTAHGTTPPSRTDRATAGSRRKRERSPGAGPKTAEHGKRYGSSPARDGRRKRPRGSGSLTAEVSEGGGGVDRHAWHRKARRCCNRCCAAQSVQWFDSSRSSARPATPRSLDSASPAPHRDGAQPKGRVLPPTRPQTGEPGGSEVDAMLKRKARRCPCGKRLPHGNTKFCCRDCYERYRRGYLAPGILGTGVHHLKGADGHAALLVL